MDRQEVRDIIETRARARLAQEELDERRRWEEAEAAAAAENQRKQDLKREKRAKLQREGEAERKRLRKEKIENIRLHNEAVSEMLTAAQTMDLPAVRLHLESLPADACHEAFRRTALHWAAENGDLALCQLLLEHKADPNFKDKHSATPLHKAAWNGQLEATRLLLEAGADPSVKDWDGETASEGGSPAIRSLVRDAARRKENPGQHRSLFRYLVARQCSPAMGLRLSVSLFTALSSPPPAEGGAMSSACLSGVNRWHSEHGRASLAGAVLRAAVQGLVEEPDCECHRELLGYLAGEGQVEVSPSQLARLLSSGTSPLDVKETLAAEVRDTLTRAAGPSSPPLLAAGEDEAARNANSACYSMLRRVTAELLRVEEDPDPVTVVGEDNSKVSRYAQTDLSTNSGGKAGGWHRYTTMTTGHVAARLLRHSSRSQQTRRIEKAIAAWRENYGVMAGEARCKQRVAEARQCALTADAVSVWRCHGLMAAQAKWRLEAARASLRAAGCLELFHSERHAAVEASKRQALFNQEILETAAQAMAGAAGLQFDLSEQERYERLQRARRDLREKAEAIFPGLGGGSLVETPSVAADFTALEEAQKSKRFAADALHSETLRLVELPPEEGLGPEHADVRFLMSQGFTGGENGRNKLWSWYDELKAVVQERPAPGKHLSENPAVVKAMLLQLFFDAQAEKPAAS